MIEATVHHLDSKLCIIEKLHDECEYVENIQLYISRILSFPFKLISQLVFEESRSWNVESYPIPVVSFTERSEPKSINYNDFPTEDLPVWKNENPLVISNNGKSYVNYIFSINNV
jgi:hypothetical protein